MKHLDTDAMGMDKDRGWLGQRFRNLRNKLHRRAVFSQRDIESRFTKTYELNYWGDAESRSGSGSTMVYTTGVRQELPQLIEKFGIKTMFDAPCGDWNWMRTLRSQLKVDYIGGDIVRPLIEANSRAYGSDDTRFIHANIVTDSLPTVDLWFCRDCMFHLSYADGLAALRNFVQSGSAYALITTHKPLGFANGDIVTGDFRPIDLMAAPYNLPRESLARFDDYLEPDMAREMCLWSREQIAAALNLGH